MSTSKQDRSPNTPVPAASAGKKNVSDNKDSSLGFSKYAFFQIVQIALALSLPVIGWLFAQVIELENRVTTIEATYLTSRDGQQIAEQLSMVWQELAKMPNESPPRWFVDRVNKLESSLNEINTRVREIERSVK